MEHLRRFSPGESRAIEQPFISQAGRVGSLSQNRCLGLFERTLLCLGKPSLFAVLLVNQLLIPDGSSVVLRHQANATGHGISEWEAGYVQLWETAVQDVQNWKTGLLLAGQVLVVVFALALQVREQRHVDEDFSQIIKNSSRCYRFFYAMVGVPAFVMAALAVGQRHDPPYSPMDLLVWTCMTLVGASVGVFYARLYAPCMTVLYQQGWLASRQFMPPQLLTQRNTPSLTSGMKVAARSLFGLLLLSTAAGQFALTSSLGWAGPGLWCNLGLAVWCNVFESLFHADSWVTLWVEWPAIRDACRQHFNCLDYFTVLIYSIAHGMLGAASCIIAAQLPPSKLWLKGLTYTALAGDVVAATPEALIHVLEDRFEEENQDEESDNMSNDRLHSLV